ncbi:MAG: hypothetical protein ACFFG0_53235 [Candidatus Thorarchaeota archaeon]
MQLFILKFIKQYNELYYNSQKGYTGVKKEEATKLIRKDAIRIQNQLKSNFRIITELEII